MTTPYNEALGATLIERTKRERIVLVGVTLPGHTDDDTEAGLDELALLVDTAGADEAGRLVQRRDAPDHTWFIGKGKVEELRQLCLEVDADTVVFDNELSPAQQFNLEKLLGRTAIDRTAVILDIFGQNAHTLEGKAQVELALLRYRLPRLRRGAKGNLSQQSGGIGTRTRGKGETKLEIDRRTLMRRITRLEHDLAGSARHPPTAAQEPSPQRSGRGHHRRLHQRRQEHACSTGSRRRACWSRTGCSPRSTPPPAGSSLPGGEPVLLTDTVGFVRRLPHGLIEAFKSTLEVASEADFLVHVVDSSAPDPEGQIAAVRSVLAEIDADQVPELLVFNKADIAPEVAKELMADHEGSVARQRGHRRGHRRVPRDARRSAAVDHRRRSSCSSRTNAATCWRRSIVRARWSRHRTTTAACGSAPGSADASAGRLSEFVVDART